MESGTAGRWIPKIQRTPRMTGLSPKNNGGVFGVWGMDGPEGFLDSDFGLLPVGETGAGPFTGIGSEAVRACRPGGSFFLTYIIAQTLNYGKFAVWLSEFGRNIRLVTP